MCNPQDAERGKAPPLLSRNVSVKSIFEPADGASAGGAPGTSTEVEVLRQRVADLEIEVQKLRSRNQQLEAVLGGGPPEGLASGNVVSAGAPPPLALGSSGRFTVSAEVMATEPAQPSPLGPGRTSGATPRVSDDDVRASH